MTYYWKLLTPAGGKTIFRLYVGERTNWATPISQLLKRKEFSTDTYRYTEQRLKNPFMNPLFPVPLLVALARVFNSGVVLRCCTTGGGEHEQHRGLEDDDEMANDKRSLVVHYLSSFFPAVFRPFGGRRQRGRRQSILRPPRGRGRVREGRSMRRRRRRG